ncbi:FH1/FH2 domain-containing protein 1 [Entelurus aequoreus]|uniref:FH1/FH2 domain-containing protein 1 n=1 Tax=Entelurus aequoreus TaxID=161455 RepID=UPI002B1DC8BD|nr:FH1/FH2 domain-containing protein 1 [Entelurus aequoreus]
MHERGSGDINRQGQAKETKLERCLQSRQGDIEDLKSNISSDSLKTRDFSDLWDEEELDSTEDEGINSTDERLYGVLTPPPPPPPLDQKRFLATPKRAANKCATLKLHWRALPSLVPLPRRTRFGTQTIWAGLEPVHLDTDWLELLFEWKGKSTCLRVAERKQAVVSVLGMTRSNNITITMSRLPPLRLLPPAIYSMDISVLDREDIQRLQTLIPTEEELCLIKEAKTQNPSCPLATAELCLQALGEIPHLSSRLNLWAFALDYDSLEQEIAEPLFHLKVAMEQLVASETFRHILATVLAIGNFLNGCKARGFELSYLGKLSQVKDTRSRQPLLHHVCVLLLQLYPQSSDLYSELTAVSKAGKCDYSLVQANLDHLCDVCKVSWQQMKMLDRAEECKLLKREQRRLLVGGGERLGQNGALRHRLSHILRECEDRMKVLRAVHRRVVNRFHSFLLFLGYSKAMARETRAEDFCRTISNFSLEFRAAQQTILLQRERAAASPSPNTPARRGKPSPKHVQAQKQWPTGSVLLNQESEQHRNLEAVLTSTDFTSKLDVTLPRHRRRMLNNQGPLSAKLKR